MLITKNTTLIQAIIVQNMDICQTFDNWQLEFYRKAQYQ